MDLQFFSGDTCVAVEIVPPLSDVYLHHFYLGFELNLYKVEMVEVSEIFFV
jgi:hypothetical protein